MKPLIITIILIVLYTIDAEGQGFFAQKSARIKNQLKQIALFEIYIRDIEKGYTIAREGLGTIRSIRDGEFRLHQNHFDDLLAVNPAVRRYSKAAEVLQLAVQIKKLIPETKDEYINAVFRELVKQTDSGAAQLNQLISSGNYTMTDDERITRINQLHADMKDRYAFAKSFSSGITILQLQQWKESHAVQTSRLLYNTTIP